jgi:predicted outer membrane repeat protein
MDRAQVSEKSAGSWQGVAYQVMSCLLVGAGLVLVGFGVVSILQNQLTLGGGAISSTSRDSHEPRALHRC